MMVAMAEPPKVLRLDEIEALAGPGTLTWHPVRHALGIRAFGCNAYTATAVGADVVEPHTESGSDHEELYFVASGLAIFTVDEQRYDAPAGTYVFVPDPESHRHAVAGEANTTVLSFGGPPNFTPSAWEWAFRAAATREADPSAASSILQEGLEVHPDSPSLLYNLACLAAIDGRHEDALAALKRSIAIKPDLKSFALEDEDFTALRDDPEFAAMTAA